MKKRSMLVGIACLLVLMTACSQAKPEVEDYSQEFSWFTEEGSSQTGLVDQEGKVILPAEYQEISVAENGLIFANTGETYRVFDKTGKQIGQDYSWIECASPGEDGIWVYRQASFMEMAPVPPYIAVKEDENGKRQCWLLDENGLPEEEEPYEDIEIYEDSITKCRDGVIYTVNTKDGTVTQEGNQVVQTYFDGKYQVKQYYTSTHSVSYALVDQEGKELTPPVYSSIQVPFEDRIILCKGDRIFMGGEKASLYDGAGKLLAESNGYSFTIQPDGSYVGTAYVGSPYDDSGVVEILDEQGNPEPQGAYFVDKDGKRLSQRYICIESYANAEEMEQAAQERGQSYIFSQIGIETLEVDDSIQPGEAFFLCLTAEGKGVRIPLKDMLIKAS